jgi:hypothetical protein
MRVSLKDWYDKQYDIHRRAAANVLTNKTIRRWTELSIIERLKIGGTDYAVIFQIPQSLHQFPIRADFVLFST